MPCLGPRGRCGGQPDVVGVAGQRREDLLAVDDPLVAVLDGGGLQRGQVGAGRGLGVADGGVQLTGEDAGRKYAFCSSEPYCWIVLPTVLIDRNGIGAPARQASSKKIICSTSPRPGPRTRWASRCRASRRRPSCGRRSGARVPARLRRRLGLDLWCHQLGEVRPQLALQRLLFRRVCDVHTGAAFPRARGSSRRPSTSRTRSNSNAPSDCCRRACGAGRRRCAR